MRKITQKYLRSLLDYNAVSGVFAWRFRKDAPKEWNTKFSGKVAGTRNGNGYCIINIRKNLLGAHRLAWVWMTGKWPKEEIDHVNGIPFDNRFINLREATHAENGRNRKKSVNNTSGFKGVYLHRVRKKWQAKIEIFGKQKSLGYFNTPQDAHAAYCDFVKKHHGEFARTE